MRPAAALAILAWLVLASGTVWAAAGELVPLASPTGLPLAGVAWRPDGRLALAVGGAPGEGVVLRVAGDRVEVAGADEHRWLAVAWDPAGRIALIAGDGGVLRTRDGVAFDVLALPSGVSSFAGRAVAWAPDGREALVAGSALLRYVPGDDRLEVVRASADEAFGSAGWARDGSHALVEQARRVEGAWSAGRLLRYDGASLAHVATFGRGDALVEDIAFAADGSAWVVGTDPATGQGPAMRWTGEALEPAFAKAAGHFTSVAWRPGGTQALLTGAGGATLAETSGAAYETLVASGTDLLAAAWHPSGERALVAGAGGFLALWEPAGQPVARIRAPLEGAVLRESVELLVRAEPRPGQALVAVEARADDGPWQPMAALPSGDHRLLLALDGLTDGVHTFEARARDDAGLGPAARVQARVLRGTLAAPAFVGVPATDADGVLVVRWTDTRADRYELEVTTAEGGAVRTDVRRAVEPAATLVLRAPGEHALRVRAWVGDAPSAWSPPATLLWTPGASGAPAEPPAPPAPKATPAGAVGLVLAGAALAALAARRR